METNSCSATLRLLIEKVSVKLFLPENIGKIINKLPKSLNALAVEVVINKLLSEQVDENDFVFLQNKTLQIHLLDANLKFVFTYVQDSIKCLDVSNLLADYDATLSISTGSVIQLLKQEIDPDTLFFQRKLKITGDTELVHHTKNIMDTFELDSLPVAVSKLSELYYQNILSRS